jgi:hypothetical protein
MILQIPARKRRSSMANVTLTASEFQHHVGKAFDRSPSQPVVITTQRHAVIRRIRAAAGAIA